MSGPFVIVIESSPLLMTFWGGKREEDIKGEKCS
jgi:hypothetical protein